MFYFYKYLGSTRETFRPEASRTPALNTELGMKNALIQGKQNAETIKTFGVLSRLRIFRSVNHT